MTVLITVFLFVAAIVLGPLVIIFTYLHLKRRAVNKRELQAIQSEISQIRAEIEDLREQIADFIIRTD